MIKMIAACDLNRTIGKDNKLMWNLKSDMEYFKNKTLNQTVIMGYNTYLSFGKPLTDRENVVLSKQDRELPEGVKLYHSIEDVLEAYHDKDIWICGGEQIYKQFLPYADQIYLTIVVAALHDGDTFFPELSDEWKCTQRHKKIADEYNEYNHWYCLYEKVGG